MKALLLEYWEMGALMGAVLTRTTLTALLRQGREGGTLESFCRVSGLDVGDKGNLSNSREPCRPLQVQVQGSVRGGV